MENKNKETNERKKLNVKTTSIGIILLAVLLTAGFFIFYYNNAQKNSGHKYAPKGNNQVTVNPTAKPNVPSVSKNIPSSQVKSPITNTSDEVFEKTFVSWLEEPQAIEDDEKCKKNGGRGKCYLLGRITDGDERLVGAEMYMSVSPTMGGSDITHFAFIKKDDHEIKHVFSKENSPIAEIHDVPEFLYVEELQEKFNRRQWVSFLFDEVKDRDDHKIFRHDTLGKIYHAEGDCLVARLPNGSVQAYEYEVPFVGEDRKPQVTFDDGTINNNVYTYIVPSCGGVCKRYVHNEDVDSDMLEKVGQTSNGDDIYALEDDEEKILLDLYNDKNTVAYFGDNWSDKLDENKYSYEEYIDMYPYLYWKDPFGEWVQFVNEKFIVAAEMCKPVVYFYSPEEKDIAFDVDPVGGFTHTDPRHDNGWLIHISDHGGFTDNRTGKYYESLLWEGIALDYSVPEKGWVISRDELDGFFEEKLTAFGLNEKEKNDFMEYWLERLDEYPFYRLSFMDRYQFDQLAPLSFSENPDNIIRVMLIANGENDRYDMEEQKLDVNVNRDGFTVVEWGGMLER